jgi:hypothetical protein
VNSGAFFYFLLHNHIINIKKKSFSGEVQESVNFPFFFASKESETYTPLFKDFLFIKPLVLPHLSAHPPAHSSAHPSTHPPTNHGQKHGGSWCV